LELDKQYRPQRFKEVIGHNVLINSSILPLLESGKCPHAILLTGPSGVGKTTIGRLIANYIDSNLIEINGAKDTGKEFIDELQDNLQYPAFGTVPTKFVIIDEVHMLSKSSFNSLLKITEEPPAHLYFCFCTTELSRVPQTLRNRCHVYTLNLVATDEIEKYIAFIANKEGIELPEYGDQLIAKEAEGSVRKALVFLSQISHCKSLEEIAVIIRSAGDNEDVKTLCKIIAGNVIAPWSKIALILKGLKEINPESTRIQICGYLNSCILNSRNDNDARKFLSKLDSFSKPFTSSTPFSDLILCVGDSVF
jgi:DNA polymerase III gamma/tau subunit